MLYVLRDDVPLVLALMLRAFPGPDDAATPYVSDAALAAQASSIEIPPASCSTTNHEILQFPNESPMELLKVDPELPDAGSYQA